MSEPTVFVVDDDPAALESVCALAESMGVHAEAFDSAEDFLGAYDPARPGCLVTDQRMPGMTGLELQRRLADRAAALPVIVITAYADVKLAVEAMQQGAVTLFEKPCRNEELWNRIREALDQSVRQHEADGRFREVRRRFAQLSPQERDVLKRVVEGKLNKVVARELGISVRTVELRRHHLLKKMQADSVPELVRMIVEADLLEDDAAGQAQ